MKRRDFIQQAALAGAAVALASPLVEAKGVKWEIGCFNRPWTAWGYDTTLKSIKDAGYKVTGLLTGTKDEPFLRPGAAPEYLPALKKRLADSGLRANMGALRSRHNIPLEESIKEVRQQIDAAKFLSLEYVLTFGVDKPDLRPHAAPDGTVTILFSDIEGSTAMTERLGDQRWLELLRSHNDIVRQRVAAHEGFEVKSEGDGFMLAFQSARKALECADSILYDHLAPRALLEVARAHRGSLRHESRVVAPTAATTRMRQALTRTEKRPSVRRLSGSETSRRMR